MNTYPYVVNGLVLAAGMSSRMQDFKPLMTIQNKTMIEFTVDQLLESGVHQVVVVLGHRGEEVRRCLIRRPERQNRLCFVENPLYQTTQMLESVKCGLQEMPLCDRFFLVPGDMPAISQQTYIQLLQHATSAQHKVIFPTVDEYRKHPPLIRYDCIGDILSFEGQGLRAMWKNYEGQILELPVRDNGCQIDVDFPADYLRVCDYIAARDPQSSRLIG